MLLLRPALDALHAAGHEVWLLAPARSAAVLVQGGALRAGALLDADAPQWGFLAAGLPAPAEVREQLAGLEVAVVFSARVEAARAFEALAPVVSTWPPWPAPGGGSAARAAAASVARWAPPVRPVTLRPGVGGPSRSVCDALPAGFVALHPGSGSTRKNWPGFPELARRLGEPVLVVVGPAEQERGFDRGLYPGAVFVTDLPLAALGSLLTRAGLVVCNDSGVAHLAAAFGAPVLALYGPTDPAIWAPWGDRVHVLRAPGGALAELAVETVQAYVAGARTSVRLIRR